MFFVALSYSDVQVFLLLPCNMSFIGYCIRGLMKGLYQRHGSLMLGTLSWVLLPCEKRWVSFLVSDPWPSKNKVVFYMMIV